MDFTLSSPATYPSGTSVKAYPVTNWPGGEVRTDADPVGTETDTQTASGTGLTFTGLVANTRYMAFATVGGERRYVEFFTTSPPLTADTVETNLETHTALTTTAHGGLIASSALDTDGTLAANSDTKFASQKAAKTYADAGIAAAVGAYRMVAERVSVMTNEGASTYTMRGFGGVGADGSDNYNAIFYFDPANYAVAGKTTTCKLALEAFSNAADPAATFAGKMYPVATTLGANASTLGITRGSQAGSTATTATLGAAAQLAAASATFTAPSAGFYVFTVTNSANLSAANLRVGVRVRLLVANL